MEPHRFDGLTRSLSARLSRRTALQASGLGLAAGLAASSPQRAATQDAPATPVVVDGVTLTPGAFLFVQSAASGTFAANPAAGTPVAADGTSPPGGGADYLLTLEGDTGNTVYFSDRPERIFGQAPTDQFLAGLGFQPDNPPNAALVTNDEDGNEDILVVELLNPTYDADASSITYGVNILSAYEGDGLAHVASRQQDEDLAPTFGEASLFIDDCPDLTGCYVPSDISADQYEGPIPNGLSTGTCWHWKSISCQPCNGDSLSTYAAACNAAYPDCSNGCVVG